MYISYEFQLPHYLKIADQSQPRDVIQPAAKIAKNSIKTAQTDAKINENIKEIKQTEAKIDENKN